MKVMVIAIFICMASMQDNATAGKLTSSKAYKYFANGIAAIAVFCASCSQAPQPNTDTHVPSAIQQHDTQIVSHTMSVELANTHLPAIDLVASMQDIPSTIGSIDDIISDIEPTYTIMLDNEVSIILTFDDGPDTRKGRVNGTRHVLDVLDSLDFNSVFFIQTHVRSKSGSYYRAMDKEVGQPLVERMHDEQHVIAVHTGMDAWGAHLMAYNHVKREKAGKLGADLERSKDFIYELTGEYPKFVRPPFGVHDKNVRQRYAKHDLKMILWDVDSRDTRRGYERTDIEKHLRSKVGTLAKEGGNKLVVLFHDIDFHTYTADNLVVYIKAIEQTISSNKLVAKFKLSKQEIEGLLED